jgi:tetratricopeptide (TPR) repeat protein
MNRIAVALTCLLVAAGVAFSDEKADCQKLLNDKKYPELLALLGRWENSDPTNPEVYIAYLNYYLAVGHMNPSVTYDDKSIAAGISKLNEGLKYGTERLDMYFGKIHILNEVQDYVGAGDVLVQVLNRSVENHNGWLWSDNKPVEDGQEFLLNVIQDYYRKWIDAETQESLAVVQNASETQIKLYPGHIYGYNNLAYSFALRRNYAAALTYFLKAEQIDPHDLLVINNIAQTYERLGNKAKAKEYYRKILMAGTDEQKKYAQEQLDRL